MTAVTFYAVILASATRIVPEHQRLDVYRLGRYVGEKGPGLVFILPFVDRATMADKRQTMLIGAHGTVKQPLGPTGTVLVELNAATDGFIASGEEIVITSIDKSQVRVARAMRA